MTLSIRRVVTGHTPEGKATVLLDERMEGELRRPGTTASVIWSSEGFPVDNNGDEDEATRSVETTHKNGSVFRVLELMPGNGQRVHRTDSLDYAVVISGAIDMELEPGEPTVHLEAGDLVVQRGTVHNWINNGTVPCVIAFVLIDATPVTANGKELTAFG